MLDLRLVVDGDLDGVRDEYCLGASAGTVFGSLLGVSSFKESDKVARLCCIR